MSHDVVKIMYLADTYDSPFSGTEGQIRMLIEGLSKNKYEPHMTLFRHSEYIENSGFPCSVSVLGIWRMASVLSIIKLFSFAKSLKKEQFSIVHIFFNDASVIAPVLLKIFGLKVIISRRDMGNWYSAGLLTILRLNSLFVDYAVVNSKAVMRVTEKKEWFPLDKIVVIYNGYASETLVTINPDNAPYAEYVSETDIVIGLVANIRPIKRIFDVIYALPKILSEVPEAKFILVGGGDCRDMEKLASKLGVLDSVRFVGKQYNPKVFIRRFDVGILCSESEGFSNSIIEYMQCCKPVICTDVGGNSEIVTDGKTGYLIDVGDVDALASRVIMILNSPDLASSLGESGYALVQSKYTKERMLEQYQALYAKLSNKALK